MSESPPGLDPALVELAAAFDIATEYWDWQGRHVAVAAETIVKVLAGLDVDAATPAAAGQALAAHVHQPWTRMLPPCLALREWRTASVWVHVTHGDPVDTWIELETGEVRGGLRQLENWTPPRDVDGRWVGEASFEIPPDLPLGYHTLHARSGDSSATMPLIITPVWLGLPERMGSRRGWGLAAQLYSVRSAQSWAVGDLADLEDLAVWSAAEHRADYVLINPLHAAEPRRAAGALAVPADDAAVRQPALPAARTHPRVRRRRRGAALPGAGLPERTRRPTRAGRADRPRPGLGGETSRTGGDLRRPADRRPGAVPGGLPPPGGTGTARLRHLDGVVPDLRTGPGRLARRRASSGRPGHRGLPGRPCGGDRFPVLAAVAAGRAAGGGAPGRTARRA